MSNETFRLGIIGVAGIANAHREHLAKVPHTEVAAIADINPDTLQDVGEQWDLSIDDRYTDYRDMLQRGDLDAISICTPNCFHAEPCIDALHAGKHVLVEKPMALDEAEAEAMVAAAQASPGELVVGLQWRFDPRARFLRAQAEAGAFGEVHHVRVHALRRRLIPSWGLFTDKEKQGGGALIDIGVHLIEMAHFIVGSPQPVTASAQYWTSIGNRPCTVRCPWGAWKHEDYTVEDLLVGFVRFADGSTLSIETSFAAHVEAERFDVQIMGSDGGGSFDPPRVFHDQNGYMLTSEPAFVGKEQPFAEKMRHFVEVCRDDRANEASGHDGLAVQRIIGGLYRSADAGREVELAPAGIDSRVAG